MEKHNFQKQSQESYPLSPLRFTHLHVLRQSLYLSSGTEGAKGSWYDLGIAFGSSHSQKHKSYISKAGFVGKYRHSFCPQFVNRWLRAAQLWGCAADVWMCGCVGEHGLGWIACAENESWTRWTYSCVSVVIMWSLSTVKRMLLQLLEWKGSRNMKPEQRRGPAMTLIRRCSGSCFAGSPLSVTAGPVFGHSFRLYGWLKSCVRKCGWNEWREKET